MKFNTIVVDDFFDNFKILEDEFKKISLMSYDEYPDKKPGSGVNWPGKRSLPLLNLNPFIFQLTVKEIMEKSQSQELFSRPWNMDAVLHLRLSEDNTKDWIHTDPDDITMIVFLGKTNLKSGLHIYNQEKQETEYIRYIQNRAVLFNGNSFHKSGECFGDNVDNGRLTLNCFINFRKW